ncbi:hypothetical protein IRP63_03945 [Clostridium botulinum]|uniref:Uncharacterized protein n=1 Tax=Clostridium botulinum C/D str. DC5 TaxID=1443128 RepID=A0A0A0IHG1_CLOBO|nr:hypothetical protein [Clostridium botulinum]KEI00978.1 hypothetical protein Z952_13450 [Clostridium botulinum C/D str. BKT75002]KEI11144.1 hypothetical protein Z954_09310 [Clostridium botulinum C/D str. BKT2873]KGM94045.1 hypothetical protein Z956_08995 [Clostridium botulinum D str. CCUG 7971]KGM99005.1 hypothetical protein Z955_09305 [Clostridium botulinum C/D str. DC5]KOC47398.1 hypothetical protein ADU88_10415 [Clostridium botulinum]
MRRYKILLIGIGFVIIVGLFQVNLNLNRQIYVSIVKDMNYTNSTRKNNKDSYDLDDMVEVLSYPQKYDVKSDTTIPKIRILFENKPFDFRVDTNKYMFFINRNVISNFKLKSKDKLSNLKFNFFEIGKKIKNIVP